MVGVQVGGEWIQTDVESLVELILSGRVDESTLARDPAQSGAPRPLIELLHPRHLEELMNRLLLRLPGMYVIGADSTDLTTLLERVEALRGWNWSDALIRSRLEWLAAWLEELAQSYEAAIASYSAYLRETSQEPHLTLLAQSNRGVLRVRLGQAEGIKDIAAAAIPTEEGIAAPMKLPAACYSLLTLLERAFSRYPLHDQVEAVLVDFMAGLPREARERCLGPDPSEAGDEQTGGQIPGRTQDPFDDARDAEEREPGGNDVSDSDDPGWRVLERRLLRKRLKILNDATFRRLNRLIVYLADGAQRIANSSGGECDRDSVAAELQLWPTEPVASVTGARNLAVSLGKRRHEQDPLDACAEAASLLYASGIRPSLASRDGSIPWIRRYARITMRQAEEYQMSGQYEPAERVLRCLSDALDKSTSDPFVQPLREEITQHLDEVHRQAQNHAQHDRYRTCMDLREQVEAFRGCTDLCQAESESGALLRRIGEAMGKFAGTNASESDVRPLLSDLPAEIQKHLAGLKRADIEQRVAEPRKRLHDTCPDNWQEPVRQETYEALRRCQVNDPTGLVEDWEAWRSRLERHQGQYHLRQVLKDVTEGRTNDDDVEEVLARAIGHDPSLSPTCAPLYCLLTLRKMKNLPQELIQSRDELLDVAKKLLQSEPLGPEALWSPAARAGLVQEACVLLRRLVKSYSGVGAELDELWQALEKSFAPAFAEASPPILREIQAVISTCLDSCPVHNAGKRSSLDPRNRLHILLQICDRVAVVAEGEELLHGGRVREAQDSFEKTIEALACERLANDEDVQLFRRAVSGLYLTLFRKEDPVHLQRCILDQIDQWVNQIQQGDRNIDCSVKHVKDVIAGYRKPVEALPEPLREDG